MENPKSYKGIEYVQLNELPEDQQNKIKESLNQDLFIKILVNGQLHQDCILYKDYSYWFESVFKANEVIPETPQATTRSEDLAPLKISVAKG